ncbi:Immunoglobulin I-set domain containing protein, partial [Aphelenchoides avenae]
QIRTSAVVDIHGAPLIRRESLTAGREIIVNANESLLLHMDMSSHPEPDVAIFVNGEKLPIEARTTTETVSEAVSICRRKMHKIDSGEYRVRLSNEHGSDEERFVVRVRDVPDIVENLHVNRIDGTTMAVSWLKPQNDGGASITGYVIEKKDIHRRVFHKAAQVAAGTLHTTIEGLNPETTYAVRVAAVNEFGVGDFTRPLKITAVYGEGFVYVEEDEELYTYDDEADEESARIPMPDDPQSIAMMEKQAPEVAAKRTPEIDAKKHSEAEEKRKTDEEKRKADSEAR